MIKFLLTSHGFLFNSFSNNRVYWVISWGYNTGNSETPIIPLIIGDPGKAQELARILFEEENVYGTPIVFPMVARELSRIRVQMNALLTKDDLDYALRAIEKVGKKLNII